MADLQHRAQLPARALVPLAAGGALTALHEDRRDAVWSAAGLTHGQGPLFAGRDSHEPAPHFAPFVPSELLALDAHYTGTFPGEHPLELVRAELNERGVLRACDLGGADTRAEVTVAGLVITRQRPGEGKAVFVTLEDETGHVDCMLSLKIFERYQDAVRLSVALVVRGRVHVDGQARTVSASRIAPLRLAGEVEVSSRDFH